MKNTRYFSTQGIILRKQQSGEHDWFLTIFTPEHGHIQALSRASRKITSHKGSHLDPLNLCSFQFYRNGERLLLTECKVENAFISLKSNLQQSLTALSLSELILKSINSDQENLELYQLFHRYLQLLNQNTLNQLQLAEFKIKLLRNAGSWPDLSCCFFCQKKWQDSSAIWIDSESHLCCEECLRLTHNQLEIISFNSIKLANFLANYEAANLNIHTPAKNLFELDKITDQFLRQYFQHDLKANPLSY